MATAPLRGKKLLHIKKSKSLQFIGNKAAGLVDTLSSLKGEETKLTLLCIHSFPNGDPTKPAANISASPMSPSLLLPRLWVLFLMIKGKAPRGTEHTGHFESQH